MVRILILILCTATLLPAQTRPPFQGTIFLERNILLPTDPTTFRTLTPIGTGRRTLFDRRTNAWLTLDAHLFRADFTDAPSIEVQVNPEFDAPTARKHADTYLPAIGRLPRILRDNVQTVWIHAGDAPLGGGNNNLLIHTALADKYQHDGILEEALCHEAAHTSLDPAHATADRWLAAQKADGGFISTYARDNPAREDLAESFLLYLALRTHPERLTPALRQTIETTIPHRLRYFDSLAPDLTPLSSTPARPSHTRPPQSTPQTGPAPALQK